VDEGGDSSILLISHKMNKKTEKHGSLATYLHLPKESHQQIKCLKLSCNSLTSILPIDNPEDLNFTMMNSVLAKHFLLKLWKKDQDNSSSSSQFGYAAMFQFCLDFYALAVKRDDGKDDVEFPAEPAKYTRYDFELTNPESSKGWIFPRNFQDKLRQEYWKSHPLCKEKQERWVEVGKVIKKCSGTNTGELEDKEIEKMLKVLAEAVDKCVDELMEVHDEFQDHARQRKKGCCTLM